MGYIGIVGPYAVGKTTASDKLLHHELAKICSVTVINCDNCLEREWDNGSISQHKMKVWQGTVAEKHEEILACHNDPTTLFICETAWTDHITGAGKIGNVHDFIVITVEPAVFRLFIQERCERKNKLFRSDYWTDKRLLYEGMNRPLNAANRYFQTVRWQHYVMDYKRIVWDEILDRLYADIESWHMRIRNGNA